MSDTNKPLPPPPPPQPSSPATEAPPSPKPATKLARIISPIATPDLHKLFSGAPQFFARSEGHHTGAPHPSTAFPWNTEVEIRDLSDHARIRDEAWGCVTALPHITVQAKRESKPRKHRAHFEPRCHERPNMLSMQGIERGTIGFGAALELGVADCLNTPAEGPDRDPELVSDRRRRFLDEKIGLRPLTDSTLIERLSEVSTNYHADSMNHHRPTVELYTELFTQILYPPSRVTDSQDPYSLQVQIEALIDVLAEPLVWFDFSIVEWRMRLGQILWGLSLDSELGDETSVNEILHEPGTQKYWLLLQILLSSELLLRLDAVSQNIDQGIEELNPTELRRFDKSATTSVKWSMILARRWLENIRIEKPDLEATADKKSAPGWLASLTGTTEETPKIVESVEHLIFEGINKTQQLDGLLHFAGNIGWPNLDSLSAKVATNGIKLSSNTPSTPFAATPLSISSQNSTGYFSSRRPTRNLSPSVQKNRSAMLQPAGWLSSSYINGLVLPGEGLSHFLIATLLENDEAAVSKLGDEANLFGGFVYSGRSFWSTGCIVGRVLAARKGAKECMGWISSDVIPLGTSEAWVDIDVESSLHDGKFSLSGSQPFSFSSFLASTKRCVELRKMEKRRLWNKSLIEARGSVLGGADSSSVLPGDFVIPSDESTQKPLSVVFESLDLFSAVDSEANSIAETPGTETETAEIHVPGIKTYSAMMRFALGIEGDGKKEVNLALSHDVNFVTAHPCVPSPFMDIIRTPTSPSLQDPELKSGQAPTISSKFRIVALR